MDAPSETAVEINFRAVKPLKLEYILIFFHFTYIRNNHVGVLVISTPLICVRFEFEV